MKNFAVFVAFSLLVAFACGQFDHTPKRATAISLGNPVVDANSVTTVLNGTAVNQTIIGCESNIHAINGVRTNNGPLNSGSYFKVILKSLNGSLTFSFGTTGQVIPFEILTPTPGFLGTVGAGSEVEFFYYCHNYPSSSPLEVQVWSDNTLEFVGYDLTVLQYVSAIKTIPASRTLASGSPGFLELDDPAHIGGENFVHYYHKLETKLTESSEKGRLFVEVTNWNVLQANGTGARLCVSFTGLVSFQGAGPSGVNLYTPGVTDTTTFLASLPPTLTGCEILCTSGDIVAADSALLLPIDACDYGCSFPEDIWIGIIPPHETNRSTYTVSLRFQEETLVEVGTIPAGNGHVQGTLGDCSLGTDPLACDDYYEFSPAPATTSTKFGPYLSVELYAVNLGSAKVDILDGLLGGNSKCPLCPGSIRSCEAGDGGSSPLYCPLILHPCQYDRTAKYTATVYGTVFTNSPTPIEYALDTFVGSWPVETVSPSAFSKPSFGKVKPEHYQHYEVTFTQAQLTALSYFQVELYSLHVEDALQFFWNFGNPAGFETECFGYDGFCSTKSNCADHDLPENTGHCRFLFLPCEAEEKYVDYAAQAFGYPTPGDPTTRFDGLKVAQLQAGTYYFAVRGEIATEPNVRHEYTYTITWNIQEEIQIFDSVSMPNAVHFLDNSQQYMFTLPNYDFFYVLRIRTTYVFNGLVATFINCDAPAGTCPCGGSVDGCVAGLAEPFDPAAASQYECELRFDPQCSGCKDKLYIMVRGITAAEANILSPMFNPYGGPVYDAPHFVDTHKPTPYVLTVIMEHVSEVPLPIVTASRAGYYHADSIERALDRIDNFEGIETPRDEYRKYYKVSFANAEDVRNDMFFVDLTVIDGLFGMNLYPYISYDGSPQASVQIDTFDDCRTHALCFVGTIPLESVDTLANFWGQAPDVSQGSCRAALQPCRASTTCTDSCISAQAENQDISMPYHTGAFDRTREYYIVVNNLGSPLLSFPDPQQWSRLVENINNIFFHLRLQIVEQTPLPLSIDNAVYGHVGAKQYVHFRYEVGSVPANSKLVFEVYRNHNEEETLWFYVNHWDGTGSSVWAGEPNDCYGFAGCGARCELSHNGDFDVCTYEVSPCDLKINKGTYFLSVSSGTVDYVWTDSTYGVLDIDFTISAKHVAPIEILGGTKVEGVERGLLLEGSSLYYSVTVPRATSGVLGRILTIELEDIRQGSVLVSISRDSPDNQCDCTQVFDEYTEAAAGGSDRYIFKRYPCEVADITTFYITVTHGLATAANCAPIGFVLRAFVNDILEFPITLTSNTTVGFKTWRYDSTPVTEFTIDPREITVVTWTVNAPVGSVMDIQINQAAPTETIPVTLTAGDFSVPFSAVTPVGTAAFLRPLPDRTSCSVPLPGASGSLSGTLTPSIFVDACDLPNSSTKFFLLFSGEDIANESGKINLSIRVIEPQSIVLAPAANNYTAVVETIVPAPPVGEELVLGPRVITTVSPFGLKAGESLTFTFPQTFYIGYGSETNAKSPSCGFECPGTCTVEVCSDLAAKPWYFGITSQGASNLTLTIKRNPAPWNATLSNLSITTLSPNAAPLAFTITDPEGWKYFSYRVPAATNSAYEVVFSGGNSLVVVDQPVYLPKYALTPTFNILLTSAGTVDLSGSCGGAPFTLPFGSCCYEEQTATFAVLGTVANLTIELNTVSFLGASSTVGFPTDSSVTVGQTPFKPSYFTFNVPAGTTGFAYQFRVTTPGGVADIYLDKARAGTGLLLGGSRFDFNADPAGSDIYSGCYETAAFRSCSGMTNLTTCTDIVPCDVCSGSWVLTVVPRVNTTVTIKVELEPIGNAIPFTTSISGTVPPTSALAKFPDANEVHSVYVHNFTTVGFNTANWIPILDDPIIQQPDYLPQRVLFEISSLRHGSNATNFTASATPTFTFERPPGTCGFVDGTPLPCLPEVTSTDAVLRCAVSFCALSCPDALQIRVKKTDPEPSPWTYQISSTTLSANYTTRIDQQAVSVGASGTTVTYTNTRTGNPSAVYFKTSFNIPANSWVDVVIDHVLIGSGDSLTLRLYDEINPSVCTAYSSAVDLCTFGNDTVCEVLATPEERCSQAFGDMNKFPVYYRVGFGAEVNVTVSFNLNFIVRSISPVVDASLTTLASGDVYSKDKQIDNGSWHFYQFNLRPTMGYDYFHLDITSVGCLNTDLEVYTSFWEDGSDMKDFDRPNKWPLSTFCSANPIGTESLAAAGRHFDILGECHVYGGLYRVAIFAEPDAGLFENFVTYSIEASLMTNPHLDLDTYCPLTQVTNATFIPRFELLVEPSNRGSKLVIHASTTSATATFTLRASKNANPYPTDTTLCGDWDPVSVPGSFAADLLAGVGSVSINDITSCEFENDIWYIYIDAITGVLDTDEITVWAEVVTQYIPVADLTGNTTSVSWSATLQNGATQTYKVLVDPTQSGFSLSPMVSASGCAAAVCAFDLVYSVGSTGFASSGDVLVPSSPKSCAFGCDKAACGLCSELLPVGPICDPFVTEYFFTVSTATPGNCAYTFEITTLIDPVVLVSGDELCVSADSFAEVHYYSVSNPYKLVVHNPALVTITIASQTGGCTFVDIFICTTAECVIPICGDALLRFTFAGVVPCGFDYGIAVETVTVTPITLGQAVAANVEVASYTVTTSPVSFIGLSPKAVLYTYGTSVGAGCEITSCAETNVLTTIGGLPTTYYFFDAEGLVLTASSAARTLGTSPLSVNFDTSSVQHFVINLPAGVIDYDVEITDLSDSAALRYEFSSTGLALTSCVDCTLAGTPLTIDTCGSSTLSITGSCISTQWLSISQCASTCQIESIKFNIKVVYKTAPLPSISGNHNTAYTVLDNEAGCGAIVDSKSYVVEVTDILSVSLRNPFKTATVTVTPLCGVAVPGCDVDTAVYEKYSCQTPTDCAATPFSCYPAGLYRVDVDPTGTALSNYAEFLVVNQWVDLAGTVSDSIIGAERHFYKVSAAGSLSVSLDITYGPALKFFVFDGCDNINLGHGFSETQVCIDKCNIWIPTKAKHSSKSTYYVEIESKTIDSALLPQFVPNDNQMAEKATLYTISTKVGTGNCAAPPSSGFCASTSFEGVNVWSTLTSPSVWSFVDPAGKDAEARCRFESMLGGCVSPSAECRSWLKVYSCLTSFPQCDASGFQTGICTDVCSKVVEVCGAAVGLNCCSDQYVDSVAGSTCTDIPPPPPPTAVSELPDLVGDDFEFPPSLDTPVFSTIQVYLPPADELFSNIPLLKKEAVVGEESSPAAVLAPSFIFCLFLVIGLFF